MANDIIAGHLRQEISFWSDLIAEQEEKLENMKSQLKRCEEDLQMWLNRK